MTEETAKCNYCKENAKDIFEGRIPVCNEHKILLINKFAENKK